MKINDLIADFEKQYPEAAKKLREDIAYQTGQMIFEARLKTGMTQDALAKKMGTKQPAIARLETGASFPSLRMLDKMAKKAFKTYLIAPKFAFLNEVSEKVAFISESTGCKRPQKVCFSDFTTSGYQIKYQVAHNELVNC